MKTYFIKPNYSALKTSPAFFAFLMISVFFFYGCPNDDDEPEPDLAITLNDAKDVTETSFTANWSVNKTNIQSTIIEVSLQTDFTAIIKTETSDDPSITSQTIDGLNGATTYYHRVKVTLDDATSSATSDRKKVFTYYYSEKVDVTTSDGLNIAGKICYLESITAKKPGILLLGVSGLPNLWKNEETFNNLVALGYVCYIFDWRGQGQSDYWPPIPHIDSLDVYINKYYQNDLLACYTYLKKHEEVDSTKMAMAGGSLGANMSLIGNDWPHIKASVALSASKKGLMLEKELQNVLYIVCEQDESTSLGFSYYLHTMDLYETYTIEPKKLVVHSGGHHGLEVLGLPDVNKEITDWVTARMND